jgi:hypothetical protein
VIEIDFWQCSDFDSDFDFDFDELCPTQGVSLEHPPIYQSEIMKFFPENKMTLVSSLLGVQESLFSCYAISYIIRLAPPPRGTARNHVTTRRFHEDQRGKAKGDALDHAPVPSL